MVDVWTTEKMPQEWNIGIVCPIHKKGDRLECRNYRGITVLNVAYKIFTNILNERLKPCAEKTLHNYQCGFRPGKSTCSQIFTIRQMLENMLEHDIETYHLFVDFRTAYDSIIREKLYEAMQ
jgi:sorting nexin-29